MSELCNTCKWQCGRAPSQWCGIIGDYVPATQRDGGRVTVAAHMHHPQCDGIADDGCPHYEGRPLGYKRTMTGESGHVMYTQGEVAELARRLTAGRLHYGTDLENAPQR